MSVSSQSSEDKNTARNVDSNSRLMRFQMGMRTVLETGLQTIYKFHASKDSVYILYVS